MIHRTLTPRARAATLMTGGALVLLALVGVSCAPRAIAPLADLPTAQPVIYQAPQARPLTLTEDRLPDDPRALPRLVVVRDAPIAAPRGGQPRIAQPDPAPTEPPAATQPPAPTEPVVQPALLAAATLPPPAPRIAPRPRPTPPVAALGPADARPVAPADSGDGLTRSLLPRARPEGLVLARLTTPVAPRGVAPTPPAATVLAAPQAAPLASSDRCDSALTRVIPRRPGRADAGSAVLAGLDTLRGSARDRAIEAQIAAGNLPPFLRALVPVTVTLGGDRLTYCVMPDYLAVGSDSDFVRMPLGLPAALRLADRFDMLLPTARMVDQIHAQARVRLNPQPMTPGPQMESTAYLVAHNATLEGQRRGAALGLLVSGHKKDLVLTNRLQSAPGRVAIYGWHRANGQPIQPLSTVHGADYADYSHGIRLIARTAYLNGRAVDLREVLSDQRLAGMVSGEGPLATRLTLAALR